MDKIVVAIVDKQALFRTDVCHALSRQPDFEVFDSAPNENPIALIEANPLDVLLLDIDYPSLRKLELALLLRSLKRSWASSFCRPPVNQKKCPLERVDKGFRLALSKGMAGFYGLAGVLVGIGEKFR